MVSLLTFQFFIVAILPLSLLGMLVYLWRHSPKRPTLRNRWAFTLLAAAVWASSALGFYGGESFSYAVTESWSAVGQYALIVTTIGVLLTTIIYLSVSRGPARISLVMCWLFAVAAFLLDPRLSSSPFSVVIAGQTLQQANVWWAFWVLGWLLPLVASWLLTEQVRATLPYSVFRNQTDYWLLVLTLIGMGGVLASIIIMGQPGWQEFGIMFGLLGALVGTINLTNNLLPDVRFLIRQSLGWLLVLGLALGATWLVLLLVNRLTLNAPLDFVLLLLAMFLVALLTAGYPSANRLVQRWIAPSPQMDSIRGLATLPAAIGSTPNPEQLARLFLRTIQFEVGTDDVWLLAAHDGVAGRLVLEPLAGIGTAMPASAVFASDSPFVDHLRHRPGPVLQVDLASLDTYDTLEPQTLATLAGWQRVLFLPLRAGETLVGVLALGAKYSGQSYDRQDLARLEMFALRMGPLLAQTQNLAVLEQVNEHVFQQNRVLAHENQRLAAFTDLQDRFMALVGPDLKRPFAAVHARLDKIDQALPEESQASAEIHTLFNELEITLDRLINTAARVQQQRNTDEGLVQLDEVAHTVAKSLELMAEARRVQIEVTGTSPLPAVKGSPRQLQDAVYHLLHNAIKFNKVGGSVTLETGTNGNEVFVRVHDSGVGIPSARLDAVWHGFAAADEMTRRRDLQRRTGMGLTLTRYIANAHGGQVTVESRYGAGSTFVFSVPAYLIEENISDDD